MSRYRPPQPKSSPYITPEGFKSLQQEELTLWKRRAEVTQALSAAAAEGDRSENAEYIYRKKQLREMDRRIRYLQKRLPDLTVVDKVGNENQVFFSAWVELEAETGEIVEYRIVGGDEIDADTSKGYISVDSPMARALLKREVDDEVVVKIGDQTTTYFINAIRYSEK
ncbi:MAG: transcription elongation factor GreB [Acidiferrobacterales bacterium]|nr:transcription elongation factor GreB [Acidiferrobacterales bacterium]